VTNTAALHLSALPGNDSNAPARDRNPVAGSKREANRNRGNDGRDWQAKRAERG